MLWLTGSAVWRAEALGRSLLQLLAFLSLVLVLAFFLMAARLRYRMGRLL